jgi:hypothetical protein
VDQLPGLRVPDWFQTLGRGAWLLVGIAVLLAIASGQDKHTPCR